ncbi:tautomerase family protein [Burkholderia gladioli]|uniref:tautomerase family protein n=1 Tax=Burkholderia gladioli TaxID=28095 RepID=UPI0016419017
MPIVNILVTREGTSPGAERTTREQKAAVYKGIADLLFTVMGKPHEDTTVVFHEHEIDDFGQGGLPLSDYREQRARDRQVDIADSTGRRNGGEEIVVPAVCSVK